MGRTRWISALAALLVLGSALSARATEYSSDSFRILDPVIFDGGQRSTSTSYELIGSFGDLGIGQSSSTSYTLRSGSRAYPLATAPVLTATAGTVEVLLSWSASQGSLGWTVSGYDVCIGTTSNTYTSCTAVGNVTASTRTELTASTTYYFRIRAKDAFGNVVVRSNEANATPIPGAPSIVGTVIPSEVGVILKGYAYPSAQVSLLRNGDVVAVTHALASGTFEGSAGTAEIGRVYTFGANATDRSGTPSVLAAIAYAPPGGRETVTVADIFIPPTITLALSSVTAGEPLVASGAAFAGSTVTVEASSGTRTYTATATPEGRWSTALDTAGLSGAYTVRARAAFGGQSSEFGSVRAFTVAAAAAEPPPARAPAPAVPVCRGADVNLSETFLLTPDGRVNLVDFSVLLSYWKRTTVPNPCIDLDGDGAIGLRDFSILFSQWTG